MPYGTAASGRGAELTQSDTPITARTWRGWLPLIGLAVAIALGAGTLGAVLYKQLGDQPGSCDSELLAARFQLSVVTIGSQTSPGSEVGNGVIIRADGIILTNAHLLNAATGTDSLWVLLNSGEQLPATLIGSDPRSDLAVLKVDRNQLPAIPLSWSEQLKVGQPVVALGSPLGASGAVTGGVISALDRNVTFPLATGGNTVLLESIQTDAANSPGTAGGALVTCEGHLIGINTEIPRAANGDAATSGVGIAVPASIARRVSQELLAGGQATDPWPGLTVAQISEDIADRYRGRAGLYVQAVAANGPAADAGILTGDLITTINGQTASSAALSQLLLTGKVGDQVPVELLREGQTRQVTITLAELPTR